MIGSSGLVDLGLLGYCYCYSPSLFIYLGYLVALLMFGWSWIVGLLMLFWFVPLVELVWLSRVIVTVIRLNYSSIWVVWWLYWSLVYIGLLGYCCCY